MVNKELFKHDHFATRAGMEVIDMGEGWAKARMLVTEQHLNAAGTCQGGALFTLADLAFAAAVNSHGIMTVSTSTNITYFKSVASGWVYAEAKEIVDHYRLPFAEVRLTDEEGELIAFFTSCGYRKKGATLSPPSTENH